MKKPEEKPNYYFVDESGDPNFYNREGILIAGQEGCSSILILGFMEAENPDILRKEILALKKDISADPYLSGIPSMKKTRISFHAKDDCPEVRLAVFKKLEALDFKAQFVVARKIEKVFQKRFNGDENKFYNHLITKLFQNVLHRFNENHIYFATRGSKNRQLFLSSALKNAVELFEEKWGIGISDKISIKILAQSPVGEPCLQIIDYLNWAVYRAFTKGEMRFYKTIESKVSFLWDIYDADNYPNNFYSRKNPFDHNKISPV